MYRLTIPAAVCEKLARLEPVTVGIILGHIFDLRTRGLCPDVSEESETIRLIWPDIVKEYERLDAHRIRSSESRARHSDVTVTQEAPPSPQEKVSPHPFKENTTSSPQESLDQTEFDRLFDEWWQAYPRKVGKKAAKTKFIAILRKSKEPLALVEQMIAAVKEQAVKLEWLDRPQYCPHPTTWLNQGRWEDEVVAIGTERRRGPRKAANWIGTPSKDLEEVF